MAEKMCSSWRDAVRITMCECGEQASMRSVASKPSHPGKSRSIRTTSGCTCIACAIQSGAVGYLTKDIEPGALIHAIRCAVLDELCIPGPLAGFILEHIRSLQISTTIGTAGREMLLSGKQARFGSSEPIQIRGGRRAAAEGGQLGQAMALHPLTEREQEILDLIRRGHKNREIAGELCVAESTVHKHVQNILEKLHARNRTEAIYLTYESVGVSF